MNNRQSIQDTLGLDANNATRLWIHVQSFIKEQEINCREAVYQGDVILSAYEFIEGCCDIVGYTKCDGDYNDEDDD